MWSKVGCRVGIVVGIGVPVAVVGELVVVSVGDGVSDPLVGACVVTGTGVAVAAPVGVPIVDVAFTVGVVVVD
jgi:hypothetical protein